MDIAARCYRGRGDLMDSHDFGGEWTRRKLRIVEAYLEFYTTVLTQAANKGWRFDTWYIDAFAGTGDHKLRAPADRLWDARSLEDYEVEVDHVLEGSARIALNVTPPFGRYRMIEDNRNHFASLSKVKAEFPGKDIDCIKGEANEELEKLFSSAPWANSPISKRQRAVVFLDPYGLSVKWRTLKLLADTQAVDVWYFFNLEGLTRNCPHDPGALDASKVSIINEVFGTNAWRSEFYAQERFVQQSLFGDPEEPSEVRTVDRAKISAYATQRFKDLFSYVSDPIELRVTGRGHAFSLYCMSNNQSHAAIQAIKKGVAAVRKLDDVTRPMPAFHRKSDPGIGGQ
jgi:three-Cys-motif partner protein